jgi:uncharacterized protein YjlB
MSVMSLHLWPGKLDVRRNIRLVLVDDDRRVAVVVLAGLCYKFATMLYNNRKVCMQHRVISDYSHSHCMHHQVISHVRGDIRLVLVDDDRRVAVVVLAGLALQQPQGTAHDIRIRS